jgi:rhodanese-related sulfurtransferase
LLFQQTNSLMARALFFTILLPFSIGGYCQQGYTSIYNALADTSSFAVPEISTQQLRKLIAAGSVLLLDTRPYEEWATGHLPGAINVAPKPGMPMSLYTSDVHEILRLVKGDKNKALVLYCNGPFCEKSKRVSTDLVKEGFTNVVRYQLGTPIWRATGNLLQVEKHGLTYFSNDNTVVWVDAREDTAYKRESLKGAVNIPFDHLTGNKNTGVIKEAKDDGRLPMNDHNTRIVVIANNAGEAAAVAAAITKEAFHNVIYFNGRYEEVKQTLDAVALPNEEILLRKLKEAAVEWKRIRIQGDTARLARLLAAEFVHTDVTGEVTNKTQQLQRMVVHKSVPASSHDDEYTYSIIDRTAIVTHRSIEGTRKLRNTQIFIWRDGRWQAIAHHDSYIKE